jgi:DNA-binding LacI/PurR family transcriptional regulator
MVLMQRGRKPIYGKLKETIIREIKNQTLKEGDAILSERLLTEKFNISRISVRKALRELIDENYLYTIPGKGTYIRGLKPRREGPTPRTHNIAYIFWNAEQSVISIPYFAHIIAGAEKECDHANYHLLISTFPKENESRGSMPTIIQQGKVDGVLLEGVDLPAYRRVNQILPAVILSNFLYMSEDTCEPVDDIDYVASNNADAMLNVLQYLKQLRHSRIGFLFQTSRHSAFAERLHGFLAAIKTLGLGAKKDWIVRAPTGAQAMQQVLAKKDRPTAIVAANDTFALDAIDYCQRHGMSIPEDFSITGFDDIDSAAWSRPSLTTVRVLTEEMGKCAARRLLEKIDDPSSPPTHILIGSSMIERESCGPLTAVRH